MSTEIYHDQVEKLRKKLEKVNFEEENLEKKSLPSRSEVHHNKRKRKKNNKIKFPLLKTLLLFFILLPVIIVYAYTYFNNNSSKATTSLKSNGEVSYDTKAPVEVQQNTSEEDKPSSQSDQNDHQDKQQERNDSIASQDIQNVVEENNSVHDTDRLNEGITTESDIDEDDQENTNNEKIIYHKVQPKETLFSIAMKYYQSQDGIDLIKKWNQINNNEILVGQVLQIHLVK